MNPHAKSSNAIALLLFAGALLLFNWPLLSIFEKLGGARTVLYLFGVWIVTIVGIGLYCRRQAGNTADKLHQ